jgi:hypothetical protein
MKGKDLDLHADFKFADRIIGKDFVRLYKTKGSFCGSWKLEAYLVFYYS